ncbi:photosynthetic NDH subunit of subcomplex B 5, chloroplastic isoform X2 [Arabidopsis lyrata subsp. lyrata]|uniref:photosynthetic NDH subunit of subcomplex B 5, chloroplastic isoform X2 n=1 Tax=Arabidopsis lyrata subsp. lyrata TaxID=81972 RepID=UPI000A29BD1F|nr:photosynthetic NDH subunit of subcomplex B 5, chloroplastic isoform X2 [Arabidopsis lyrata subsp. lyrata]|eukprot:XP_020871040.1 photosynthetic NDH subunit of subcomplex B 5, chloroplastic isoform X2 [Arabidopsis lyrata subsp. lyrata]
MATVTILSPKSIPKIKDSKFGVKVFDQTVNVVKCGNSGRRLRLAKLVSAAGLSQIEPDINEDPIGQFEINSIEMEDFKYGYYDGAHTYYEGEVQKGTFWGAIADDIAAVDQTNGFQAAGMYFDAPGEYLFIGAALFTVVFCIIEMDKPDQPHNFEPQIYKLERGARDKLINDYNTMSIWDFNDKYGDVWDFTIEKDDIATR